MKATPWSAAVFKCYVDTKLYQYFVVAERLYTRCPTHRRYCPSDGCGSVADGFLLVDACLGAFVKNLTWGGVSVIIPKLCFHGT
jgi:hypothetical protein